MAQFIGGLILFVSGFAYMCLTVSAHNDQERRYKAGDYHAIVGFGALGVAAGFVLSPVMMGFGIAMVISLLAS